MGDGSTIENPSAPKPAWNLPRYTSQQSYKSPEAKEKDLLYISDSRAAYGLRSGHAIIAGIRITEGRSTGLPPSLYSSLVRLNHPLRIKDVLICLSSPLVFLACSQDTPPASTPEPTTQTQTQQSQAQD